MELPLYRINDQVIFEEPIGELFKVGIVTAVNGIINEDDEETWIYKIDYFEIIQDENISVKRTAIKEEELVRGAIFESASRIPMTDRQDAESGINLEF